EIRTPAPLRRAPARRPASGRAEAARGGLRRTAGRRGASSRAPEDHRRALNRPVSAERADRVAGQGLDEPGPADLEDAESSLEAEDQEDERELADLDADVEEEQRERDLTRRQTHRRQSAREAEPVQEPEGEGHDPRVADREARLAPPDPHDLGPEEEDRKRDRRVQGRDRGALK